MRSPEEFKKKQGIDVLLRHSVTRIDPNRKFIEVEDLERGTRKSVPYDKLVLATGARSKRLGLAGEDAENVYTLKDLQDAIRIKEHIVREKPERVGILGSGYIGLEMAEAFGLQGVETFVLHRGDRPAGRLELEISERILKELEENGVRFLARHEPVAFMQDAGGAVTAVETTEGVIPVDMVLCAVGVVPNTALAEQAHIPVGKSGAIRTDRRQQTDVEGIFAAGDCAEVFHQVSKDWVHVPLGDVANKQGRVAGENAAGGDALFHGIVGSQCFRVFSLEVASTGITEREAREKGMDVGVQSIEGFSRVHYMPGAERLFLKLVFECPSGRLLGAHMAGREGVARRINTLAVAVQSGLTTAQVAGLDFAYSPPFSPALDPILIAAEQSLKKRS